MRRMGEWMYNPHFHNLDTSWRCVVSFTPGERPDTHWIGGWAGYCLCGLKLQTLENPTREAADRVRI
jgi:hypothetical protein